MPDLETQVEDCTWIIDDILENTLDQNDLKKSMNGTFDLEKDIALRLYQKGFTGWVNNDEFSGPQFNEISERAITKIEQDRMIYHQNFSITSEYKRGTKYFMAVPAIGIGKEVRYKDIEREPQDVLHIDSHTVALLKYQN